jgi:hypothetical protein
MKSGLPKKQLFTPKDNYGFRNTFCILNIGLNVIIYKTLNSPDILYNTGLRHDKAKF